MINLDLFKEYLKSKNRNNETISIYCRDIKQFTEYINKPIDKIESIDIELYKNYLLMDLHITPNTVNRKLVALSRFFKFNSINIDIVQLKIHNQNFLDDMYSNEDVGKMLEVIELHSDYRAKALLCTLKFTGMRISEALQVQISDIHNDTITVLGKGNKRRSVFIPNKLKDIWFEYLKHRYNKGTALFTGQKGSINRHTAYKIIKKYGELANVDYKKVTCHNFRHKYVKDLINKNVSIDVVADLVGHSDINVTRIYSRKTKKEMLDIINEL